MNTSRKKYKGNSLRKALRLQSSFTVLISIALYTLISSYLLSPKVLEVTDQHLTFISTDTSSSTQPSLQHAISQAKESITLICYSICDNKIITALKAATERRVSVRIIFDPSATPISASLFGSKIEKHARKARGLMHHKFLVIDHTVVWLSTANMTTGSLQEHGNLSLGLQSISTFSKRDRKLSRDDD
jgi:phosphatidylserine/phosphatidylglycerophosphate/cardiolipin synthase-like enzyme